MVYPGIFYILVGFISNCCFFWFAGTVILIFSSLRGTKQSPATRQADYVEDCLVPRNNEHSLPVTICNAPHCFKWKEAYPFSGKASLLLLVFFSFWRIKIWRRCIQLIFRRSFCLLYFLLWRCFYTAVFRSCNALVAPAQFPYLLNELLQHWA